MHYRIRNITPDEYPLLDHFLYEAIFVPEGHTPPSPSVIASPPLQVYIRDFGHSPDDHGLVAEADGRIIGAIWARIMDDYGHVDDETPSLALSLDKDVRGQGIGHALLTHMLALLKKKGYAQVSLSVQKTNYAVRLYRKAGFEIVKDMEEEYIMICKL